MWLIRTKTCSVVLILFGMISLSGFVTLGQSESPPTTHTLVVTYSFEENGEWHSRCVRVNADGTGYTVLDEAPFRHVNTSFLPVCRGARVSPNGRLWWDIRFTGEKNEFNLVQILNERGRIITSAGPFGRTLAAWLPDNHMLVIWDEALDESNFGRHQGQLRLIDIIGQNNSSLVLADFATGYTVPIPQVAQDGNFQLALSSDGAQVYMRSGISDTEMQLIAVNTDGSGITPLVEDGHVDYCTLLSPDSKSFVFEHISTTTVTVTASSANARKGPGSNHLVIATVPRGTVFEVRNTENGWMNVELDTGEQAWLSSEVASIDWGRRSLEIVNTDGTGRAKLYDDGRHANWSPDGEQIVFVHRPDPQAPDSLYVINRDGTGLSQLVGWTSADSFMLTPFWSPDGRQIAYIEAYRGAGNKTYSRLHIYDFATAQDHTFEEVPVQFNIGCGAIGPAANLKWSPDAEWVYYKAVTAGISQTAGQFVCNLEGCTNLYDLHEDLACEPGCDKNPYIMGWYPPLSES